MTGQGDFDITALRAEIALLQARVAGLMTAIDYIQMQRDTATQRWVAAEQVAEQLKWINRLSEDER